MSLRQNPKALLVMLAVALTSPISYAAEKSVELTGIQVIGTTPLHGVPALTWSPASEKWRLHFVR